MTWEVWAGRSGSSRWAKWVDVEAASRQLLAIESLINRADNASLMGDHMTAMRLAGEVGGSSGPGSLSSDEWAAWETARFTAQQQRCVELATAIRAFGLAVDLDVFGLAPYAPRRIAADNGGMDYGPTSREASAAAVAALYDVTGGTRRQEAFAFVVARYGEVRDSEDILLDTFWRVDFDASGSVAVLTDVIDPDSGSDRREGIGPAGHAWHPWDGYIIKTWVPPAGAASSRAEVTVLFPLQWSWELLLGVGRLMVARKINGTLALSAAWVAARNFRLSKVLGGRGLPATIVEASASVDVALLGNGGFSPTVDQLLGAVVAIAAAINPIAGLVVGIAVGLAELLSSVLPPAVAYASDAWGHRLPFLQSFALSGQLAPREAPTHALASVPELFARVELPTPNPWAEGLMSSDPDGRRDDTPPAEETGDGGGGGGGGAVAVGLLAAALALLSR